MRAKNLERRSDSAASSQICAVMKSISTSPGAYLTPVARSPGTVARFAGAPKDIFDLASVPKRGNSDFAAYYLLEARYAAVYHDGRWGDCSKMYRLRSTGREF